jgi:hypothetical protein
VIEEQDAKLLQIVGMTEAEGAELDLSATADELATSEVGARERIDCLDAMGLILSGLEEDLPPMLLRAGRQALALGDVSHDVLTFLPKTIDDLHARDALISAGTILTDEYRGAVLDGRAVEHARDLVPAAFAGAITELVALDLYAATVALMARLSASEPAGCVAEEVVAVGLIQQAGVWLEMRADKGEITEDDFSAAGSELHSIFDLFEDDDVLGLFEMSEPADAAVQGHTLINQQLGVADQRIEAWFQPFSWTIDTGYLHDRPKRSSRESS